MSAHSGRLPMIGLLALSTTAFLTILTETMPAAVLPAMSESLEQPPLVSVYWFPSMHWPPLQPQSPLWRSLEVCLANRCTSCSC